jgi:hypothetical protein
MFPLKSLSPQSNENGAADELGGHRFAQGEIGDTWSAFEVVAC